jgi:hypothetical protein
MNIKLRSFNLVELDDQLLRRYNNSMGHLLFITNDSHFIHRIGKEFGSETVIAESLFHGAELISNPNNSFKAIFLNPNDPSFSALKFLELAVTHRPATPVFFIDSESEMSSPEATELLAKHHIRRTFRGDEAFHELNAKTGCKPSRLAPKSINRTVKCSNHPGFVCVPSVDFIHHEIFAFDVFLEDDTGSLTLFATAGSIIKPKLFEAIGSMIHFFIRESNIIEIKTKIRQTQKEMVFSSHFPISWKAAETLYKAKTLLQCLQSTNLSDAAVSSSHEILGEVFHLVGQLQAINDSEKLNRFIEQAHNCDRNIACATLSILMCKSLKYEKNAIEEILGLASFFQDIALYNSPFGDLSKTDINKMTPQEREYYLNHPTLSADILAENTSIPAVTLQVIRQHHERKDRSGFPRKIGGMQLHPMAEVLSLINDVIDKNPQTLEDENEIYRHYSDRIVLSYKGIQFRSNMKAAA